jgi:hypothetical protein
MTQTTNANAQKGKILMLAMTLVVFLAVAATALAATAEPAHAGSGTPKSILFFGTLACDVWVKELGLTAQLQRQNANGGWSVVDSDKETVWGGWSVQPLDRMTCAPPYVRATYRTVSTNGYTIAGNDYKATYTPKYSGKVSIVC